MQQLHHKFQQLIEKHWYYNNNPILCLLLLPLCGLFFLISNLRRLCYKFGILKSYKLPVPVIIIGNISVGGAGKTPLTKYLAHELTNLGISVGVILRGYKGKNKKAKIVRVTDNSKNVGDEALIYAKNNIKVAIGSNRYLAGKVLLKEYPNIELILSDDGLQHYGLQRDYEIAIIDSTRVLGNRFLLPMGPLRETCSRLQSVNAVVINGKTATNLKRHLKLPKLVIEQRIILDKIYNPKTNCSITTSELNKHQITAIAAIGNPGRFFDFLITLGIKLKTTITFPDHYQYSITDIPKSCEIVLVTEKDYTKLGHFNLENIWVVLVTTKLNSPQLVEQIYNLV